MSLTDFRTLGRSGLVVSPLALGTMTFGPGEWGADETTSRAIFNAYRFYLGIKIRQKLTIDYHELLRFRCRCPRYISKRHVAHRNRNHQNKESENLLNHKVSNQSQLGTCD